MGRHERSERWFASAREAADARRSNRKVRLPLVWALTECGREQEAHAGLAKLPKATKRRESAQVARNAAECGHVSAVLDLPPGTEEAGDYGLSSGMRTWGALSALRTIAIGVDVDVW